MISKKKLVHKYIVSSLVYELSSLLTAYAKNSQILVLMYRMLHKY